MPVTPAEAQEFFQEVAAAASPEEQRQHEVFLKEITNPIWKRG